jgi:hypothetical protein
VVIDAGQALGAYGFDLAWDPTLLALEGIGGGTTAEFTVAPICAIDATAGTARCAAEQATRADGPTGAVSVARARFTSLGSASLPTIALALQTLTDPAGAPLRSCARGATCDVPQCDAASDCEDGDPCTVEGCLDGHCTTALPTGADGVRCQLEQVRAKGFCGRDPINGPLGRMIARRVRKGLGALDRASTPGLTAAKRARFLRRVDAELGAIVARVNVLVRQERFPPKCGAYIEGLVTSSRALVAGLSF